MPVRRITAASLITALIYAPFAVGAEGPSVAAPIVCAAPGVNNRVMTHVATSLQSPRVFFKATGPEYYVDMHHGAGDEWWAVLPAVEPSTRAITYRAAAQDAKGNWVSGTAMTINTSASCPVSSMSDTDIAAANNIVLGLTTSDESPVPAGFSCKGVKTIIAANGQMRPAEECRVALARLGGVGVAGAGGAGAAAVSTVGPGGLSLAALAALTIGGAAAGYAVYKNNQGNNKNISPSRP
jgi:hypothetical protein